MAVEVDTGERWTGTLELTGGVVTVAGETTRTVPFGDVVALDEPEFDLWDRLDYGLTLGLGWSR